MIDRYLMRLAVVPMIVVATLILCATAVICLLAALFMGLTDVLTPPLAALATGGAALIVATLVLLAARIWIGRATARLEAPRRTGRAAATGEDDDPLSLELGNLLGREVAHYIHSNPKKSLLISFCGGLAAGMSPGLRKLIRDLF